MPHESDADRVREYARKTYVEPARARRDARIRIVAGDVQNAVHLTNRIANVCQALKGPKFLKENHLTLEKWEGPPSGISTTVAFTYRVVTADAESSRQSPEWPFLRLRGIAKDVFSGLGGGEAFLRKEREQFYKSGDPR